MSKVFFFFEKAVRAQMVKKLAAFNKTNIYCMFLTSQKYAFGMYS